MTDYLTVTQLADYLGIPDADDDTMLAAAITASSRAIDSWCGRSFGKDTVATARVYRADTYWSARVDDLWDLATLVVKTDEGDNGTYGTTWTVGTDFLMEPNNGYVDGLSGWPYSKIVTVGSRWFPTSCVGSGRRPRIQVTAKWGWSAVPAAVTQAAYIKAARIFRRKDSPEGTGGFDNASGFAVPLIRPMQREDPDLANLLAPYRRLTVMM